MKRVEVPLTFDAEFFDILLNDVSSLDALQTDEQKILTDEIKDLSKEITAVTKYEDSLSLFDWVPDGEVLTHCQAQNVPENRYVSVERAD